MTPPCLYQTVHVLDGRALFLREHLTLLERWGRYLFGLHPELDEGAIAARIASLAAPHGCDRSQFVRLTLATGDGRFEIGHAGVSLYRGYDLRSLTPDAVTLRYETPLFDVPTSAREAADALAAGLARRAGASVAVRCNGEGMVLAADGAPLFAVRGRNVRTSPAVRSVERDICLKAIRTAGLRVDIAPLRQEELRRCDEVFYFDHRGVTALGHCDGVPYMSLIAERIARAATRILSV